jgi:hypothetical protein
MNADWGKYNGSAQENDMPSEVKIYECEVKKLVRKNGANEWLWVVRPVKDAISDGVTEFRCKDCHGAVKVHGKACCAWPSAARRT